MRCPARAASRVRTDSGRLDERATSKRSCTAVETLLTFCPPGPEARMKDTSISCSGMVIPGAGLSITAVYTGRSRSAQRYIVRRLVVHESLIEAAGELPL